MSKEIETLAVNTIRTLAMDAVQNANSGHPGMPMGMAPTAYVLWKNHLVHDPDHPGWPDRDRFVLSAGHGSMLLYAMLHLTGYDLSLHDLEQFRQWESKTPGHPEYDQTPGVEATTGPLGQGLSNAVGFAIAERALAHRFNRGDHAIVDHYTYSICSDGDMMEGVTAEACSLAGHLGLGKLIAVYDSNHITLDGPASMAFTPEEVAARYEAYGWQVLTVEDGDHDTEAIDRALVEAREDRSRPSLIVVHSTIGYGSPNKADSHEAHGSPLGEEEVARTKEALGWDPEAVFQVPEEVAEHMHASTKRGRQARAEWQERFESWAATHPALAEEWRLAHDNALPGGWDEELPVFEAGQPVATRSAAGKALNAIARRVPWLLGGDADLSSSTKTTIEGEPDFSGQSGEGRNIRYGVREHAMGAASNGIAYHGGLRPFAATFFVFSDYMRPTVRLAAMNELPVIYHWTHDSIGLGEDGPTHQPVEHLMSLRAMPNIRVVRPADANEAAQAWRWAMTHTTGPVALVLTRQKIETIDRERFASAEGLARGAYVLADPDDEAPRAILLATGSEVSVALEAWKTLAAEGIPARVVSMPCWETFAEQSDEYREEVLPPSVRARVSIEAGTTLGWERWIGEEGVALGVDRFGASAPGKVNFEKYGLTADRVVDTVRNLLGG